MGEWLETAGGTVYPWHLDHMDHMNVQHFVARFDDAVWHLFAALGITPAYLRDEKRGMAAIEMKVRFRREVFAGDLLRIRSGIRSVGEKSLHLIQEMVETQSGEVAAVQEIVAVHMDRENHRSLAFPAGIADRARAAIVSRSGGA